MILDHTARALLTAPLRVEDAVERLGRSLWLYLWLVTESNARGVVCRTSAAVAGALGVSEAEIAAWLTRLSDAGLVHVLAPAPHLVVKLAMWSGSTASIDENPSPNGENSSVPPAASPAGIEELASMQQQASLLQSNHGVGSPREGVFAEVAEVIGASDAETIRDLLPRYPEALIREALARVQRTPSHRIRKNRLALFRYLLTSLTTDSPHA
jgi:hypothetical protein